MNFHPYTYDDALVASDDHQFWEEDFSKFKEKDRYRQRKPGIFIVFGYLQKYPQPKTKILLILAEDHYWSTRGQDSRIVTGTKKTIFITMITTRGLVENRFYRRHPIYHRMYGFRRQYNSSADPAGFKGAFQENESMGENFIFSICRETKILIFAAPIEIGTIFLLSSVG